MAIISIENYSKTDHFLNVEYFDSREIVSGIFSNTVVKSAFMLRGSRIVHASEASKEDIINAIKGSSDITIKNIKTSL